MILSRFDVVSGIAHLIGHEPSLLGGLLGEQYQRRVSSELDEVREHGKEERRNSICVFGGYDSTIGVLRLDRSLIEPRNEKARIPISPVR